MLAFATYITDRTIFAANAERWFRELSSSDAITAESQDEPTIAKAYNEILDVFSREQNIEALVLCRENVVVRDVDLAEKIRKALIDDSVAIIGVDGVSKPSGLPWWEDESVISPSDQTANAAFDGSARQVDVVNGRFVIISRWAIDNLRFDDRFGAGLDGLVEDLCMQARDAGKTIGVLKLDSVTSNSKMYTPIEQFRYASGMFQDKWSTSLGAPPALSTFLEIGGGTNAGGDWLNIDTEHAEGPFLRGAQETPWPIPDDHLCMIWASHVMEHIPAGSDRIAVMNEAWRVLRPGGAFEIRTPCFPDWSAIADPTHVSYWVPQSFLYFTGELGANADYGTKVWQNQSIEINDGWELRGVLRKPLA